MYWTLELASKLEDAPWPATKDELIDYANRSGLPEAVLENLQEIEEDDEVFESIEELMAGLSFERGFSASTKMNIEFPQAA